MFGRIQRKRYLKGGFFINKPRHGTCYDSCPSELYHLWWFLKKSPVCSLYCTRHTLLSLSLAVGLFTIVLVCQLLHRPIVLQRQLCLTWICSVYCLLRCRLFFLSFSCQHHHSVNSGVMEDEERLWKLVHSTSVSCYSICSNFSVYLKSGLLASGIHSFENATNLKLMLTRCNS